MRVLLIGAAVAALALNSPAAQVFIRANQVGYLESDPKIAIAFAKDPLPETFTVADAKTRKVVFTGRCVPVAGAQWGEWLYHSDLDFSSVAVAGWPGSWPGSVAGVGP